MAQLSLEENIHFYLDELIELVSNLKDDQYNFIPNGRTASVGRHLRHTLEIFLLLVNEYDSGKVNYEARARNPELEKNRALAIERLNFLKDHFQKPDKSLGLLNNQIIIGTSYYRELLYQLEHIIHHNAIIRPVVEDFLGNSIRENFGYAPATIKYQAKHVSG